MVPHLGALALLEGTTLNDRLGFGKYALQRVNTVFSRGIPLDWGLLDLFFDDPILGSNW
jgi:hypothetical protein